MAVPPRSQEGSSLADTQIEEHTHIRSILDRLRSARDADALRPLVAQLAEVLPSHFQHETAPDGVFDTVQARDPAAGPHIERFREQHVELLAQLDALSAALAEQDDDVLDRARELCDRLARHEAEENDVLFDALYVDTGDYD